MFVCVCVFSNVVRCCQVHTVDETDEAWPIRVEESGLKSATDKAQAKVRTGLQTCPSAHMDTHVHAEVDKRKAWNEWSNTPAARLLP